MTAKPRATALIGVAYYPALMIAAALAFTVPALLLNFVSDSIGWKVAAIGAVLCLPLFIMVLFDRATHRAVEALNALLKQKWVGWSWRQRLFAPEYGDRAALYLNRLILAEAALSAPVDRIAFAVAFAAFSLTTLLLMLLQAYPRSFAEA